MACTVPARTTISTSELATTPGKRLVMPRNSTAAVPGGAAGCPAVAADDTVPPSGVRTDPGGRYRVAPGPDRVPDSSGDGRRHLDGAVDDLLLQVVELGLDVIDLATGGGVGDTVGCEVEALLAGLQRLVLSVLEEGTDRHVDPLEHRGDDHVADVGGGRLVLVGVDADRLRVRRLRRLEDAGARAARRGE